ncbi:hypothetical protein [Roseobacter sinensis]|uniref:Uncharacterized protein n=1 Tax=Roseobacter sinensis TaxID=2931391 RepID=A0ABT3BE80_9RHOB|nr:hypothetical protein [Roseobacter sp. WL0113]MCV3271886.1 hypothetical protein [Roseobacter sp. WL0113]
MISIDDLQAHWQRDWIKAPGVEDRTTQVHWMQCGPYYADLRIPDTLPDISGARALDELDTETLLALMRAEGFAGTVRVDDGICTWERRINWHGTPSEIDAGRLSFDDQGALIEDGVHAEYRELWLRCPHPPIEALGGQADGYDVILLSSEATFLLAVGVPEAPPATPLVAALERGERPEGLAQHFSSLYVMGLWDGADGIARLTTDPRMKGDAVLSRSGQQIQVFVPGFEGGMRRMSVPLTALA